MKVSRDKAFDHLCKLEKGKISARLVSIRKRHQSSIKLPKSLVTPLSQKEWSVQSEDKEHEYSVILEVDRCPTMCHLLCNECKICILRNLCNVADHHLEEFYPLNTVLSPMRRANL